MNGSGALVLLGVHEDLAALGKSSTTLLETGLSEGVGGLPLGRGPGSGLGHHLIDLLQGQTLGLVNHEVDESDADEAEAAPDEEDLGLQVGVAGALVDHVGGGVGDGPVEEPVGGGGHGEGLGADLEGEDLAGDNPGDWTPGGGDCVGC